MKKSSGIDSMVFTRADRKVRREARSRTSMGRERSPGPGLLVGPENELQVEDHDDADPHAQADNGRPPRVSWPPSSHPRCPRMRRARAQGDQGRVAEGAVPRCRSACCRGLSGSARSSRVRARRWVGHRSGVVVVGIQTRAPRKCSTLAREFDEGTIHHPPGRKAQEGGQDDGQRHPQENGGAERRIEQPRHSGPPSRCA